jgi:hypothetical protein
MASTSASIPVSSGTPLDSLTVLLPNPSPRLSTLLVVLAILVLLPRHSRRWSRRRQP